MPTRRADTRRIRLDDLFEKVGDIGDQELQAEFSQYLCVRVSAFVEQSVEHMLIAHTAPRSSETVAKYVGASVGRTNLNAEQLLIVVGRFDAGWRRELEDYIRGERKDALDSVVNLRNRVAHGDPGVIAHRTLSIYYDRIKEILERLETLCLP